MTDGRIVLQCDEQREQHAGRFIARQHGAKGDSLWHVVEQHGHELRRCAAAFLDQPIEEEKERTARSEGGQRRADRQMAHSPGNEDERDGGQQNAAAEGDDAVTELPLQPRRLNALVQRIQGAERNHRPG